MSGHDGRVEHEERRERGGEDDVPFGRREQVESVLGDHAALPQDLLLAQSAVDLRRVVPLEEVHGLVWADGCPLRARHQVARVALGSLDLDQVLDDLDGREAVLGRMGEQRLELALRGPKPDALDLVIDVAHDAPPFFRS